MEEFQQRLKINVKQKIVNDVAILKYSETNVIPGVVIWTQIQALNVGCNVGNQMIHDFFKKTILKVDFVKKLSHC